MKEEKIKYIIYCRKSSEAEDKQVQSIETQKRELLEYSEKHNLEIVDVMTESQSAHKPGRPVFNQMLHRIEKGEANAILVLFPNRISRNPIDAGKIIYMLDMDDLIVVKSPGKEYHNGADDKFFLYLELIISKKDSDQKSEFVKTGLRTRYLKGYPNGVAPIGFLNDKTKEKGDRGWIVDKIRFPLVKQVLELFSTGKYSIRQITNIANEEMGLRTTEHKKQGGKKLVHSHMTDTILKNPVYAGFFFSKDKIRHELTRDLPRAIDEETFWIIQKILGNKGRPRPYKNKKTFAYTGLTTCGGCGGTVVADPKYQLICSKCKYKFSYPNKDKCPKCEIKIEEMENPLYLYYPYYHCSKKKCPHCAERGVLEDKINELVATYYKENLKISPALSKWCIDNINVLNNKEEQNEYEIKESLQNTLQKAEKELTELTLMRARGLVDDDSFIQAQNTLKDQKKSVQMKLSELEHIDPKKLDKIYRAFDLSQEIDNVIKKGTAEEKKTILLEIGSNLTLKDKIISISNNELYSAIINGLHLAKQENPWFEPEKYQAPKEQNTSFEVLHSTLLRG